MLAEHQLQGVLASVNVTRHAGGTCIRIPVCTSPPPVGPRWEYAHLQAHSNAPAAICGASTPQQSSASRHPQIPGTLECGRPGRNPPVGVAPNLLPSLRVQVLCLAHVGHNNLGHSLQRAQLGQRLARWPCLARGQLAAQKDVCGLDAAAPEAGTREADVVEAAQSRGCRAEQRMLRKSTLPGCSLACM